jgi:hypothetical protein
MKAPVKVLLILGIISLIFAGYTVLAIITFEGPLGELPNSASYIEFKHRMVNEFSVGAALSFSLGLASLLSGFLLWKRGKNIIKNAL